MAFQNTRLQKLLWLTVSWFGEKIKKGRTTGITDQDAEDTGKETAMNFGNSLLLQQYNQDKYCWTNRASNMM